MEQEAPITLDSLAIMIGNGFKEVNNKIDKLDGSVDKIETRLDRVEVRLNGVEVRLDRIENLLLTDQLQRIERLEDKVHLLEVAKGH